MIIEKGVITIMLIQEFSKLRSWLALLVATVATDNAVFVATLPVSQNFPLSLLFYL